MIGRGNVRFFAGETLHAGDEFIADALGAKAVNKFVVVDALLVVRFHVPRCYNLSHTRAQTDKTQTRRHITHSHAHAEKQTDAHTHARTRAHTQCLYASVEETSMAANESVSVGRE